MTVVLSVVCSDGLVVGADKQITESDRGLSYPAHKLHALGEHAAWGGSGARSVLKDLEKIFAESAGSILESDDVGRSLQERVLPVLRHHYQNFIEDVPGERAGGGPSAYVLAAGYSQGPRSWWRSTRAAWSAATRTSASTPSAAGRRWPSRQERCWRTSG